MSQAVTAERWERAQAAELDYWRGMNLTELLRILAEKPDFLSLLDENRLAMLFRGKEVLEIGCGPLGIAIASFYRDKAAIRRLVKLEPLPRLALAETAVARVNWAAKLVEWAVGLAGEGDYLQRAGETPGEAGAFDTVISYNVLDHVQDPLAILRNAHAALRPGGAILVGVDCLSVAGRLRFEQLTRRRFAGTLMIEGHPHSFLPSHMAALLSAAGFGPTEFFGLPGRLRRLLGSHFRPAFLARKPGVK
jgi:SAM-dependent methyltransferase